MRTSRTAPFSSFFMQHTLLPFAVALLAASSFSQQPLLPVPVTLDYTRPIGANPSQPLRAGVAGDFDGDSLADLAYRKGSGLEVVFAPGLLMAPLDGNETANDVASLRDGASSGADAILTVGPLGLRQHTLDWVGATPVWVDQTLESGWGGAVLMDCRTFQSQTWIFGLQSDQRTVRGRAKSANSPWAEGQLFTTGFDVVAMKAIHYIGDNLLEVAVCGEEFWEIWRRNGSPFAPWVRVAAGQHALYDLMDAAVGTQAGSTLEWLAVLANLKSDPDRSHLIVHDLLGTQAPEEIQDSPGAVAIAAGDFDDNAAIDIVLSIQDSHDVLVAVNQGGINSASFDGTRGGSSAPTRDIEIPGHTGPASGNQVRPVVADLDNDDLTDFCFLVQSSGHLFVHRDRLNGPPVPGAGFGFLSGSSSAPALSVLDADWSSSACLDTEVLLPIRAPAATWPSTATHFETHLWYQPAGSTGYTQADTINYNVRSQASGGPNYDLDLNLASVVGNNGLDPGDPTIYYVLACFAEISGGTVTRILRPRLIGFQTELPPSSAGSNQAYLEFYAEGAAGFDVDGDDCLSDSGIGPGIWSGGGVPVPCLPEVTPGELPRLLRIMN